jgi:pimeloyl-ACP methyl ester carboxylesterase
VHSVESWLTSSGLRVSGVGSHNRYVTIAGSVAQANKAFSTSIQRYRHQSRTVQAPSTALKVPASLASVRDLAVVYVALLDLLDLEAVTIVGHSIGGWIAAEMALLGSPRVCSVIVVDAVGIEVPGHPVADFFSLSFTELAELSYADPARYGIDPSTLPPAALQAMAGNRAALEAYAGRTMTDPTLRDRLAAASVPTLVVWGDADRIGDPDFGRAFAAAIPVAEFTLIENAGHLPQIEAPEALVELVWSFADRQRSGSLRS